MKTGPITLVASIFGEDPNLIIGSEKEILKALCDSFLTMGMREALVLSALYGLAGKPNTVGEIAEHIGLTRQRIYQIRNRALRKLRHPSRSRYLRRFLGDAI